MNPFRFDRHRVNRLWFNFIRIAHLQWESQSFTFDFGISQVKMRSIIIVRHNWRWCRIRKQLIKMDMTALQHRLQSSPLTPKAGGMRHFRPVGHDVSSCWLIAWIWDQAEHN
jgi:hypothetical protein